MASPLPSTLRSLTCIPAIRAIAREFHLTQRCQFSSSSPRWPRGVKGSNKMRGLSAIRSKGPITSKIRSIKPHQLPVPVMDPNKRARIQTSDDHGLWAFFNKKKEALTDPKDLNAHGRAWTKKELRIKGLDDLHSLWWKCHLELNRLATESEERKRLKPGYGMYELDVRVETIKDTQKAIREALEERYDAWQEARAILLADQDPDIEIRRAGGLQWKESATPYEFDEVDEEPLKPMESSKQNKVPVGSDRP